MVKKLFAFLALLPFAAIFYQMALTVSDTKPLTPLAQYYAEKGPDEVGSANLVTSIVVTYRGFDTLGEVTILFVVASIIGYFLKNNNTREITFLKPASEILKTGSYFIVPLSFMLGVYVFINGHLTPGGGFPGGAIIASGTMLLFLVEPTKKAGQSLIRVVESLAGVVYVLVGIAGLALAGGFLDNRILPLGNFGTLLSAGAIPVIYSLIGLKVGAELSAILYKLKDAQEDV